MKKRKLLWQLFFSLFSITLLSVLTVSWLSNESFKKLYHDDFLKELGIESNLIKEEFLKQEFSEKDKISVDRLCKNYGKLMQRRVTVILFDGTVLGDSLEDPAKMENHADRPEIRSAWDIGQGKSERFSYTLGKDFIYVAVPLYKDKKPIATVRISIPSANISSTLKSLRTQIIIWVIVVALIAAALSFLISNRISRPIKEIKEGASQFASGNLNYRLSPSNSEELATLAEAMNQMAVDMADRINTITKQKNESEAILNNMMEAVIVVDNSEHIIRFNETAGILFGVAPSSAKGKTLQEIVRNNHLQNFVKDTFATNHPLEDEIILHEPKEKFLQSNGTILKDSDKNISGAVIVLNDITRLKKLENIRSDFVSNVSHELKTPITSIKGFVETLNDGALDDPNARKKFLDIIATQSDRLNSIIEDLLSLSRIEQIEGKEDIAKEKIFAKELLTTSSSLCQFAAREKRVSFAISCEENIKINVNPPLMEQAITNLLDNAIKYSEPEKIITLKAKKNNTETIISIIDEGQGISKEHLSRIFERFYRVDKARSRKLGGTGLGLAIVKHIVNAHRGTINVESDSGKGSTFSIRIPS